MKLKIFHEKLLSNLKSGILNNTELYFNDDFEYPNLNEDTRTLEDFNIEINALEPIINYQGSSDIKDRASSDADFSTIFYNAFRKIPPNLAKDERLWAYLTHTLFFNYTKARFDITRESSKKIKQHFFCFNGERGFERDNACSRLWWIGFIANRVDDYSFDKVVKAF